MLQEVQIKHSKLTILKQYLLQIPVCQYSQALNHDASSCSIFKNRNIHYSVEDIDFSFHRNPESHAKDKAQYEFTFNKIKERYDIEK